MLCILFSQKDILTSSSDDRQRSFSHIGMPSAHTRIRHTFFALYVRSRATGLTHFVIGPSATTGQRMSSCPRYFLTIASCFSLPTEGRIATEMAFREEEVSRFAPKQEVPSFITSPPHPTSEALALEETSTGKPPIWLELRIQVEIIPEARRGGGQAHTPSG